jgi:hypothetical protein
MFPTFGVDETFRRMGKETDGWKVLDSTIATISRGVQSIEPFPIIGMKKTLSVHHMRYTDATALAFRSVPFVPCSSSLSNELSCGTGKGMRWVKKQQYRYS